MSGRNLFESYQRLGRAEATSSVCVFISHKSDDKPMARAVAAALLDMGADIYFDENDRILQAVSTSGNDAAVVGCIEDGLNRSTHLLGLITKKTFDSWWVPYEIGGATGRKRQCGHLVAADVTRLPSYVKVAPLLLDLDDLACWMGKQVSRSKDLIKEAMASTTKSLVSAYVPAFRSTSQITFY
jgi:hypothetical protein